MIRELQNALRNANHVGDLVLWRAGGNVTPDALRAALDDQGLTEIDVPTINPETAFSAAVRDAANANGLEVKVIRNDPGTLAFAFIDMSVSGDIQVGDRTGRVINRLAWLKVVPDAMADQVDANFPVLFDEPDDNVATVVRTKWEHHSQHLSARAIRDVVTSALGTWGSIRMHRGGMYYLPAARADDVRKLRSAMATVGTTIFLMPLPDVDDSKAAIGMAAREQVSGQIADLRKEAQRWRTASRNPRTGTLEGRLESYRELKDELENMADVLAIESEDLQADIDGLVRDCEAMLGIGGEDIPEEEFDADEPAQGDSNGNGGNGHSADAQEDEEPARPAPPSRPASPSPFASMTVAELRREAREHGIRTSGLNKAALVAALNEANA